MVSGSLGFVSGFGFLRMPVGQVLPPIIFALVRGAHFAVNPATGIWTETGGLAVRCGLDGGKNGGRGDTSRSQAKYRS